VYTKYRICPIAIKVIGFSPNQNLKMTVREEHKLRVFENRVLRRIFGPKRME
jgi:hypothetical protein